MNDQDRIKQLKEELKKYTKSDEKRLSVVKDRQKIAQLKKQIREKKYAGIVQTGKNLKHIGKGIGKGFSAVGKGMGKFIGEEPLGKDGKKKHKTVEEMMRDLPQ